MSSGIWERITPQLLGEEPARALPQSRPHHNCPEAPLPRRPGRGARGERRRTGDSARLASGSGKFTLPYFSFPSFLLSLSFFLYLSLSLFSLLLLSPYLSLSVYLSFSRYLSLILFLLSSLFFSFLPFSLPHVLFSPLDPLPSPPSICSDSRFCSTSGKESTTNGVFLVCVGCCVFFFFYFSFPSRARGCEPARGGVCERQAPT